MKHGVMAIICALAAVALAACEAGQSMPSNDLPDGGHWSDRVKYAAIAAADRETLITLPAEAMTRPAAVHRLSPPLAAMAVRVLAVEGQAVSAGDPLAELRAPSLEAWKGLRASLEKRVALLTGQLESERERLSLGVGTRAEVARAEGELNAAEFELTRLASQQKAQRNMGLREGQAADGVWRWTAPRSGAITKLAISAGQFVSPEEHPITLVDLTDIEVRARVPERWLPALTPDTRLLWRPAGYPQAAEPLSLSWRRRDAAVDPADRTVACYFAPDAMDSETLARWFPPGRTGRGSLTAPAEPDLLLLPKSSVIKLGGRDVVFLPSENPEKPRWLAIEILGRRGEDYLARSEALVPGDRVAVQGVFLLKSVALLREDA